MMHVSEICMALCICFTNYTSFHFYRSFNREHWYYRATMPVMGGKGTSWPSDDLGLTRLQHIGKGMYRLSNPATGRALKKTFNGCRQILIQQNLLVHPNINNAEFIF